MPGGQRKQADGQGHFRGLLLLLRKLRAGATITVKELPVARGGRVARSRWRLEPAGRREVAPLSRWRFLLQCHLVAEVLQTLDQVASVALGLQAVKIPMA